MTEDKIKREAEDAGLILLRSADRSYGKGYQNYKEYRFKECGHTQYCQPTHVRRKNIKCNTCFIAEIEQTLNKNGYTLIGHNGNSVYKIMRKECEHIYSLHSSAIRTKTTDRCSICYEERVARECLPMGLELKGKIQQPGSKPGQYRRYRFISCGHEIETCPEAVRDGRFECKICISNEFASEVAQQGLEVLSGSTKQGYRYFNLPCGCQKEIRMDHARQGSWICENCNETPLTSKSNVYLLKIQTKDFSWLKLGFAKQVNTRASNYGLPVNSCVTTLKVLPVSSGYLAMGLEKGIHGLFKEHRLDKNYMREYHRFNGHTECYPLELEELITTELNKYETEETLV